MSMTWLVFTRTFAKAESLSSRMNEKGKSCRVCRDLNELLSLKPDFLVELASPNAIERTCIANSSKWNFNYNLIYWCFGGLGFYNEVMNTG